MLLDELLNNTFSWKSPGHDFLPVGDGTSVEFGDYYYDGEEGNEIEYACEIMVDYLGDEFEVTYTIRKVDPDGAKTVLSSNNLTVSANLHNISTIAVIVGKVFKKWKDLINSL